MSAAQPLVSLIVAMAQNGVIGRDNALPWRLPADLRRFRASTLGKTLLMGRKTFESIGRPLPERENLVLTRDRRWLAPGVIVVHSVEQALAQAGGNELVAIGGAQIYRLVLPFARRIYLTHVHADVPGDTFFPEFDDVTEWILVDVEHHESDEKNDYPYSFLTYQRGGRLA